MKVIVTLRAEIIAGADCIWFTEDQLAGMTDAELRDLFEEDLLGVLDAATGHLTIERQP